MYATTIQGLERAMRALVNRPSHATDHVVGLLVASPFFRSTPARALRQETALGLHRLQHQDRRLRYVSTEDQAHAEAEPFHLRHDIAICSGPSAIAAAPSRRGRSASPPTRAPARDRRSKAPGKCGDNCKIAVWACTPRNRARHRLPVPLLGKEGWREAPGWFVTDAKPTTRPFGAPLLYEEGTD